MVGAAFLGLQCWGTLFETKRKPVRNSDARSQKYYQLRPKVGGAEFSKLFLPIQVGDFLILYHLE